MEHNIGIKNGHLQRDGDKPVVVSADGYIHHDEYIHADGTMVWYYKTTVHRES